jgi:hypothetical protein
MPALCVWTPEDGLLGALAPLGLAAAAGTALVIDLDPGGPHYPGEVSLADLVGEGPRRDHLSPSRSGVAVLRNGGVTPQAAAEVVAALVAGWDRVVLRLPPRPAPAGDGIPVAPVRLLAPGGLFSPGEGRSVFQATPALSRPPGPGVRLPVPSRGTVAALALGRRPRPGDRWVAAWRRVWEVPWRQ